MNENNLKENEKPAPTVRDSFCIYPFKSITIMHDGTVNPCCAFLPTKNYSHAMSVYENSLEDIWNSSVMREIRHAMTEGYAVAGCEYCYWYEQQGGSSMRTETNKSLNSEFINELKTRMKDQGFRLLPRPEYLELDVGNACNLKCRMCNATYSSKIAADAVHSLWSSSDATIRHFPSGKQWFQDDDFLIKKVLQNPEYIKKLYVIGGEPLVIKKVRRIMQHLIDIDAAKNIILAVTTNGTVADNEWFALAANFKSVIVNVSIDGFGPVNDYIRFPSQWETVAENIRKFRAQPNTDVFVGDTIQAYNILDIVTLIEFCRELDITFRYSLLQYPPHLSIFILPIAIRREAAHRLRSYQSMNSSHVATNKIGITSDIQQLISDLEAGSLTDNPNAIKDFMTFTNDLDLSRGQNINCVFPELVQNLTAAGYPWISDTKFSKKLQPVLENKPAPRLIAFYLTQFYRTPENDLWWGKGFTEWTNVTKAKPLFTGHYQPHLPSDFGFYDLRVRETRREQIEVAKHYGIDGFCYHYYWFSGTRILNLPLDDMLADPESDMPFCLCWANENWTRRWDASDNEILIAQKHLPEDNLNFIKSLVPFFKDRRYIRVDGKPFLIVYRPQHLPDARKTVRIWREYCQSIGLGDIHVCAALTHGNENYTEFEFDSGVEFPPHNVPTQAYINSSINFFEAFQGIVMQYATIAQSYLDRTYSATRVFKTVFPSWDNTARTGNRAFVVQNGVPENYEHWLSSTIDKVQQSSKDDQLVFINAWNEWAEGCHLEPDRWFGHGFLQATLNAKNGLRRFAAFLKVDLPLANETHHRTFWKDITDVAHYHAWLRLGNLKLAVTRRPWLRRILLPLVNAVRSYRARKNASRQAKQNT